jgi:thioredoxin 1
VNRFGAIAALMLVIQTADAVEWPYNEKANAAAEIHQALEETRSDHKLVLLVFGANWCANCREFDRALHGTSRALIDGRFHVVKIDIGNFDKNLGIAARYDDPIKMGIPAIVLLSADDQVIYSTKGGELANARKMGETGIYEFLSKAIVSKSR